MSLLDQMLYSPPSYREWQAKEDQLQRTEAKLEDAHARLRAITEWAERELARAPSLFAKDRIIEVVQDWTAVALVNADALPRPEYPPTRVWVRESRYRLLGAPPEDAR